ncbi:hypothetical protein KPL37_04660 [Clostridium frigoris]|uniref:Uncharacterized protein n=1 Tax=Clostridium frigoris TaxID=205327 RepID=A0ABS6BQ48_9CLOT|nr:hypothetical protein [Clostridium frigoris]MBU3159049.1 hypothetical protein [Clostridium frigoris]
MKKLLSKLLGILVLLSMLLPSSSTTFGAELSNSTSDTNINITNNAGEPDILNVTDLIKGDIVNVYSSATGGISIGTATANKDGDATVSITQLGTAAGNDYVSVKSTGLLESNKIRKAYDAEAKSTPLDPTAIVVTNNAAGTSDTVVVQYVAIGDIINVYSSAIGGDLIGTANATVAGDLTASITQLGAAAGNVYISIIRKALLESARTIAVGYVAEAKSSPLDPTAIVVTNNAIGTLDTVVVQNLAIGDIINVYSSAIGGELIGTATEKVEGDLTVSIPQIEAMSGNVYVSVTSKTLLESDRTSGVRYDAEAKSAPLDPTKIIIINNAVGTNDTVVVKKVDIGDIVNVYSSAIGGGVIGTATATVAGDLTVSITQIGVVSGSVYVSVIRKTFLESYRTIPIPYAAEAKSIPLDLSSIIISNNASRTADTVVIQSLEIGDIVKVYSSALGGAVIGTATATASGLTVSITQIGAAGGTVYVSVIRKTFLESNRTSVTYAAEAKSTPINLSNITVTNNAVGTADTVVVRNLVIGDVVKVYSSATAGLVIGTATVTLVGDLTVSITQLGAISGSIYVSVTSEKLLESNKTKEITYASEAKSTPLDPINIIVINNSNGISNRVLIQNLAVGDIVKIYSISKGGPAIGKGTVITTKTDTVRVDLFVNITQIGEATGSIYVSVTKKKLLESDRILATRYF